MSIKIATLNLCLGLTNKKNNVKQILNEEDIDVLCLQETEVDADVDAGLMSLPGYCYESETNDTRSRVGIYVNNTVDYTRRRDLESINSHIIVIDIKSNKELRIINLYRSFNPPNNAHPKTFFESQLHIIKNALNDNCILLGDFNLDLNMKGIHRYPFKRYFEAMDENLGDFNLLQMVNFNTWSRVVNGVVRESAIDHLYCSDPSSVTDLHCCEPIFGDHKMIMFNSLTAKSRPVCSYKRSWIKYKKEILIERLSRTNWDLTSDTVQDYWNQFETKILQIVDDIAPMTTFKNNTYNKNATPDFIKKKTNLRKRLIKTKKYRKDPSIYQKIKDLNREIKAYYNKSKSKRVRQSILPGNTQSLWRAVKIAKDVNTSSIPNKMYTKNEVPIDSGQLPQSFADFFDAKIRDLVEEIDMDDSMYNGKKKLNSIPEHFMGRERILQCIKSLSMKNTEGYDRIPQRILVDGSDHLLTPLTRLFDLIYNHKQIPEQWKVSKTVPIYKNKGNINNITNYRPIANLCSTSKLFEKLILKRILEIQELNNEDITGQNQHGFKKGRGTATLSAELQNMIARAMDGEEYVLVASLDLSAAFDLVDVKLLIKRLIIIGLPDDVIQLINEWLTNRYYYVDINGKTSTLFDLLLGTVQGSILGPILYALFVSPLWDVIPCLSFADDSYLLKSNKVLPQLIKDMEKSLEAMTKWLKKSGLKVNEAKTEVCFFCKNDTRPVEVMICNSKVTSKSTISVLGIIFDSKLNWSPQVHHAIKKANKALNAIKLIRKYFNSSELIQIITSNFYSLLYYNSEIWYTKSLNANLKQQIFASSARALKLSLHYPPELTNYMTLHKKTKRATPEMYNEYKLSLMLFKLYNECIPNLEWVNLNFQLVTMSRQTHFCCIKNNNSKIGLQTLTNRFHCLNNKIPLDWLNLSLNSFKINVRHCF